MNDQTSADDREAVNRQTMADLYSRIDRRQAAADYAASLAEEFHNGDVFGPDPDTSPDEAEAWRWRYILHTLYQRAEALRTGAEDAAQTAEAWTSWADDLARLTTTCPETTPALDPATGERDRVIPAHLDPTALPARLVELVTEADAIAGAYARRARALASDRYRTEEEFTALHATPPAGHDDAGPTEEDPA